MTHGFSLGWTIFGVLQLSCYGINLLYASIIIESSTINPQYVVKTRSIAWKYVAWNAFAMLIIFFGNFLYSVWYSNAILDNLLWYILIIGGNLSLSLFAIKLAACFTNELKKDGTKLVNIKNVTSPRKRKIAIIASYFCIFLSIPYALTILFGETNFIFGLLGILCGQFAIFFFYILISGFITIGRTKLRTANRGIKIASKFVSLSIGIIVLLPLLVIPSLVVEPNANFTEAFGKDWESKIDPEDLEYLMPSPYTLPSYFLGLPHKDHILRQDVLFYEGPDNRGGEIQLYFDAYLPPNGAVNLPGKNSTIIRIHGGGWVLGDKGRGNMMQNNKYLASQGYVVFDVQYGIHAEPNPLDPITPQYKIGNFSVDDMLGHLGKFTDYLYTHASEYGANLNSTFISGGSAGGQLCVAMTLAMHTNSFPLLFSSAGNYTIKGMIPFYPANGEPTFLADEGTPEIVDPSLMIDDTCPPCILFHGTKDGMVDPEKSRIIKSKYTENGIQECAIIWLPYAGHANDIYFSGGYSQIFLYYMERFLILYQ